MTESKDIARQNIIKQHPYLYHYTTMDGLWSILNPENKKKRVLWASHYKHLNDAQELVYFNKILKEKLTKEGKYTTDIIDKLLNSLLCSHDRINNKGTFILSFCGHHENQYTNENGLLSQWRGYGHDGGAIIVFDSDKLLECQDEPNCIYSTDQVTCIVNYPKDLSDLNNDSSSNLEAIINGIATQKIGEDFILAFLSCYASIKHPAFSEEQEVRIVSMPTLHSPEFMEAAKPYSEDHLIEQPVLYRKRSNELVPYIEIPIENHHFSAIQKIIIGPHANQQQRLYTIKTLLAGSGIEVSASEIPLRC